MVYLFKMVIFHGYVKEPEGNISELRPRCPSFQSPSHSPMSEISKSRSCWVIGQAWHLPFVDFPPDHWFEKHLGPGAAVNFWLRWTTWPGWPFSSVPWGCLESGAEFFIFQASCLMLKLMEVKFLRFWGSVTTFKIRDFLRYALVFW